MSLTDRALRDWELERSKAPVAVAAVFRFPQGADGLLIVINLTG
jgi:hypothetical protein